MGRTRIDSMLNLATSEQKLGARPVISGVRAWGIVAIALGLAFVVRLAIDPIWADRLPYGSFFLASLVVMHRTKVGPCLFYIFASFILGTWFFLAPRHTFIISSSFGQF